MRRLQWRLFSKISKAHYGRLTARNKATCSNMLTIRRDESEKAVLNGLKTNLMQLDDYGAFVEEFTREYNAPANAVEHKRASLETKLTRVRADIVGHRAKRQAPPGRCRGGYK